MAHGRWNFIAQNALMFVKTKELFWQFREIHLISWEKHIIHTREQTGIIKLIKKTTVNKILLLGDCAVIAIWIPVQHPAANSTQIHPHESKGASS